MTYQVRTHPDVTALIKALSLDDQEEVKALMRAIAADPYLAAERVWSYEHKTFKRDTHAVSKQSWPKGLRLVYQIIEDLVMVAVIDAGDHQTSARNPGKSVYPDER